MPSRQLAAIMFTDMVGYTKIMGEDEQKAVALLEKNRLIQKPLIEQHNGRWIKELGDGVLATFATVTDAVHCAGSIINACRQIEGLQLRIGIHQAEVIMENDDVFGDGVNIAARIQAVAAPGAIYISEAVQNNLANKKEISTRFAGEERLKNVKEAVRIYEVLPEDMPLPADAVPAHPAAYTLAEKSIAVLPFANMSNDPEQEYFCDGISEEIINALAQLDHLRVVARTSSFAFKGKNLDVREIGKTLNVHTLLEGSVRKAGNHLRITTKLVQTSDGAHVWSNRYDRVLEDVFSIQEDIAANVATALQGFLTHKEKEAIRRPETDVEAYECFLKGRQFLHQLAFEQAKALFEQAIRLDPGYAPAYAGLADVHSWLYEWVGAREPDLMAADKYSQQALSLAPQLSESHSSRGYVLSLGKRYDEAEQEFEAAIRLNANSFDAYYFYGRSCFARGQIQKSADLFFKASEVRREDFQSLLLYAQSLSVLGKEVSHIIREGANRARKQLELNPNDRRALSLTASSLLEIGEREEALQWINKALELYPEDAGVLINAACVFAKDGNKEKALSLLETAFGKGYGKKDWIMYDPDYDPLRNEPRFQALLNRLQ